MDVTADYFRSRVAARADRIVVTSSWMVDRLAEFRVPAGLWVPGVDIAAFTPALRDEWLHDRWPASGPGPAPWSSSGTSGSIRNRHDVRRLAALSRVPGIRPVVEALVPAARTPTAR